MPGPLVPYRRIRDGARRAARRLEGSDELEQHLRFQLPAAALPLQVERAASPAAIEAASRRVFVSAGQGEAFTEVYNAERRRTPIRVEIGRPDLLARTPRAACT